MPIMSTRYNPNRRGRSRGRAAPIGTQFIIPQPGGCKDSELRNLSTSRHGRGHGQGIQEQQQDQPTSPGILYNDQRSPLSHGRAKPKGRGRTRGISSSGPYSSQSLTEYFEFEPRSHQTCADLDIERSGRQEGKLLKHKSDSSFNGGSDHQELANTAGINKSSSLVGQTSSSAIQLIPSKTEYNTVYGSQTVVSGDQYNMYGPVTFDEGPLHDESTTFDLLSFKERLVNLYEQKTGHIVLYPWNQVHHDVRYMDDIYVELELEQAVLGKDSRLNLSSLTEEETSHGRILERNEDVVNLKTRKDKFAKRIIIKGLAGSGKSSLFSKLAYDWSQQKPDSSLKRFELLFLLRMRDIHKGHSLNLIDLIKHQIIEYVPLGLETYISHNQSKILILMDGWDETDIQLDGNTPCKTDTELSGNIPHEIVQILTNQKLRDCCVIVSTRPHKQLGHVQPDYLPVNLRGFSHENIKKYIIKFFSQNSYHRELPDSLIGALNSSQMLQIVSKIPVILMLLCTLWEDKHNFPATITLLYQEFIETIWMRYIATGNRSRTSQYEFAEFLYRLGDVALKGLFPSSICSIMADDVLEFAEEEIDQAVCQLGLEVGLITRQRWHFRLKEKSSISFLHKSVQEFLAGFHFSELFDKNRDKFVTILKQINSWELVLQKLEVLKFCCGISQHRQRSSVAFIIIRHIYNIFANICTSNVVSEDTEAYCKYDSDHLYPIDIGDVPEYFSKHNKATNCVPLLTLLHEAQLQVDPRLLLIFKDSVFSNALSVNINCSDSQALMFLKSFIQCHAGKETADNIKSICLYQANSLNLISDILNHVSDVQCIKVYGLPELVEGSLGEKITSWTILSTLILQNTKIDLSDLLSHLSRAPNKSLRHVDFRNTPIGDAINDIGAIMTPHLTCLIMRGSQLSESHIEIFSEHLPHASNLMMLDLSNNAVGDSIGVLAQHLQFCKQLQVLKLKRANLNRNHIKTLSIFLSKMSAIMELEISGSQ